MEANKAPKKIYLNPTHDALTEMLSTKIDGDIEYIQIEAFIEKAEKWISNNCYIPHATLENFKNYMMEEKQ